MGIKKIAEITNVSIATVSRVLNTPELVKKETKDKVLKAAKKLNYIKYNSNYTGAIKKNEIGVIMPDIINNFFAKILEGIVKQARKIDLPVTIYFSNDMIESELDSIEKLIEKQISGVILIRSRNKEKESFKSVQKLNKNNVPFVLVDRDISYRNNSGVFLSNANAVYDAINLLINDGYEKITIITGPDNSLNSKQRLEGYRQALLKNNIPIDENIIYKGDFSRESGFNITTKLLKEDKAPSIIFSCANQITLGCLKAISEQGLRVGKDIKLFSFNKLDASYINNFNISYIEHQLDSMGEKSVTILNNKLVGTQGLIREILDYKIHY